MDGWMRIRECYIPAPITLCCGNVQHFSAVMCVGEKKIQKKGREHLQKRIGSESLTVYVYRDIQWPPIIMMLGKIEKKERFNMF